MQKINQSDFKTWAEYYWTYQYKLASDYYIPYLKRNKTDLKGISIIDIGCGDGGFISAFKEARDCIGLDIKPFSLNRKNQQKNLKFKTHNILLDDNQPFTEKYDLVILRDVFEHINMSDKKKFLKTSLSFMKNGGKMLVTFPPYYSPFGLHQQTLMQSFLRKVPCLNLLPYKALKFLILKLEGKNTWKEAEEIIDSKVTIGYFNSILKDLDCQVYNKDFFLVRPSHQIRYGLKMRRSFLGNIPFIREFGILGTCYIIQK